MILLILIGILSALWMKGASAVLLALLVVAVVGLWAFFLSIVVLKENERAIVERWGVYSRVLGPGIHFLTPLADRCRSVSWHFQEERVDGSTQTKEIKTFRIKVAEQIFDFPATSARTRDRVNVEVNVLAYYEITDPKKAVYGVNNLLGSLQQLVSTAVRSSASQATLDDLYSSGKTALEGDVMDSVNPALSKYGAALLRVDIQAIEIPAAMQKSLDEITVRQREAEALMARTTLEASARVTRAQAEAKARELEVGELVRVLSSIKEVKLETFLEFKRIEAWKAAAARDGRTIVLGGGGQQKEGLHFHSI